MQSRRRLLCIRKMKYKQNNGGCNQGLHPPLFFYCLHYVKYPANLHFLHFCRANTIRIIPTAQSAPTAKTVNDAVTPYCFKTIGTNSKILP